MTASNQDITADGLRTRAEALPGLTTLRDTADELPLYLVGGTVRDLALGLERVDVDIAVEASPDDVGDLARRLDPAARVHERFGTATVRVGDASLDLAATRAESYEHPGALPSVRTAPLVDDLARRDFTVNAVALALTGEPRIVDPHGGLADLRTRRLRVLHERSFVDDPTRALRAARYAPRLGLILDPATEAGLRAADLATVSAERVEAELRRLASESRPLDGLRLLVEWGLVEADVGLAGAALDVLANPLWAALADSTTMLLAAGAVKAGRYRAPDVLAAARELAAFAGSLPPSKLTAKARGRSGVELVVARALGAEWLDRYAGQWREVRLEIDGNDLLTAGIEEGPAVGRGLTAALAAKLDGQVEGREEELTRALEAARAHT